MTKSRTELLIEKLEGRRLTDEAKLKRLQAKNRKAQRVKDTRRKILLGSYILTLLKEPKWMQRIYPGFMNYLEKEQDKKLFNQQWLSRLKSQSKDGENQSNPDATE